MDARGGDGLDFLAKLCELIVVVIVVESLGGGGQALFVPSLVIASVQTNDCQCGVGHLPNRWDRIRHSLRLIHDHVDQVALALERQCHRSMLVFEPGLVAELDGKLIALQLPLALLDVRAALGVVGDPGCELKMDSSQFAGAPERFNGFPVLPPHLVGELARNVFVI